MKGRGLGTMMVVALLSAGCLLEVETVRDPGPAFAEARREAARVEGRPGRPDTLRVLVYDRKEGQLVRASVPLWVVEKAGDSEIDVGLDDETAKHLRAHLRRSDLEEAPPGPLVEVDEEDGDQVIVWLE